MTAIRLIARPMLASVFFVGAASALKNAPTLAPKASRVTEKVVPLAQRVAPRAPIPTDPVTIVRVNAVVQIVAAAALATGRVPRLSSTVLAASLLPTTVAGHAVLARGGPRHQEHPAPQLLQGRLAGRRPADRRRRHRGQARGRLARPSRRPRRTPGGQVAGPPGPDRGPGRQGPPELTAATPALSVRCAGDQPATVASRRVRARTRARASVSLPGSKSLTNRALVLAALADGPSVVRRALALARHRADGRRPGCARAPASTPPATTGGSRPAR